MRVLDLGPLEIEVDQVRHEVAGALASVLLGMLASRAPATVPVGAIAVALWGDPPPDRAAARIEQHIWRLRLLLAAEPGGAEAIVRVGEGYALRLDPDALDSSRFDRLLASAREDWEHGKPGDASAKCEAALDLWRGDPYGAHAGVDWAIGPVTRLREHRRAAALLAADCAIARGRPELASEHVDALLAADPLDEPAWERRIRAEYAAGRQAAALAAYRQAHRLLAEELGVAPGQALREIHTQVLRHEVAPDPAGAPAEAGNLPGWLTSFVGREAEVDDLVDALSQARLVSLVGTGGVGKTRLAALAARRVSEGRQVACCFVDLAPVVDPEAVANAVVLTLRVASTGDNAIETAARAIARRRMLLVLDNCEQVVDSVAAMVSRLLSSAPGLTVLATTREPLGLAGERIWHLDPLQPADAERLFAERIAETLPQAAALEEDDQGHVARACRAVDGLPLGVELAASRVRALGVRGVADQLDRGLDVLAGGADRPDRHRSLRAAIDWSYRLADPDEQVVFARLAAVHGAMSLEACMRVIGHRPLSPDNVAQVLAGLVDRSLVDVERINDGTRYRLLMPLRRYADDLLTPDERRVCLNALVDHLVELAGSRPVLGTWDYPRWLPAAEADVGLIEPALEWAFGEGDRPEDGARILGPFTMFFTSTMRLMVPARWLPTGLSHLPALSPLRARLAAEHGLLLLNGGTTEPGSSMAREGIIALHAAGQTSIAAELAAQLAMRLVFWVGDADLAEQWLESTVLDIDDVLPGMTAAVRATAASLRGDDDGARRWLAAASGAAASEGMAQMVAAQMSERAGDYASAEALVRASLERWIAMGTRSHFRHLAWLARLRLAQGDAGGAVRLAAAAEENVSSIGAGLEVAFHASLLPLLDDAAKEIGSAEVGAAWVAGTQATTQTVLRDVLGPADSRDRLAQVTVSSSQS